MTYTTDNNVSNTQQAYGAALLRVTLGTLLLSHGLLKVFVFTVPGTVGFFSSMGLPPIAAYLTIFAEVAGGTALIAGILTRLAAILSLPLLLGAVWAHSGNGWLFSNAGGGWEFPLFLVAMTVVVAIQGGGAFQIGHVPLVNKHLPKLIAA